MISRIYERRTMPKLDMWIKSFFPTYRKKNVLLAVYPSDYEVITEMSGWDCGSRYEEWEATHDRIVAAPQNSSFAFSGASLKDYKVALTGDKCKVTTGTFDGKTATIRICCTQEFFNKFFV